jgi:hypothetical protein
MAFSQTGWMVNPNCANGDCAPSDYLLPVYGNIGMLGLLNGGGGVDPIVDPNPCNTAARVAIPIQLQWAMARANGGIAVSSIDFSVAGPINGVQLSFFANYNQSSVTVQAFTTLTVEYHGPDIGLSIGASNPVSLPSGTSFASAQADLIQYNNGQVTNVSGSVWLGGLVPVPYGSQMIQNGLNSNSDALASLGKIATALGGCATAGAK